MRAVVKELIKTAYAMEAAVNEGKFHLFVTLNDYLAYLHMFLDAHEAACLDHYLTQYMDENPGIMKRAHLYSYDEEHIAYMAIDCLWQICLTACSADSLRSQTLQYEYVLNKYADEDDPNTVLVRSALIGHCLENDIPITLFHGSFLADLENKLRETGDLGEDRPQEELNGILGELVKASSELM